MANVCMRNILGLWGGKVGEGISVCQALQRRLGQGHTLTTGDEICVEKLKKSISRLSEEIQRYTNMEQAPTSPEMEEMIDELTTMLMTADDIIVSLTVHVSRHATKGTNPPMSYSPSSSAEVSITTSRLPILNIPKFNGDILQWHEFWSKFQSIIEGRKDLTDVDKLTYLQSALEEGEAKQIIAGLATTNETYQIAVEALMEEYGEKGILVDAHYMALFSIQKANHDIKENKRILTEIDRHFRVLNAMGETTGNNNALRAITVSKFSTEVQSDLRMMLNPCEENVDNIISALKVIIKARDGHPQDNSPSLQDKVPGANSNFTTEALYSQQSKQNPSNISHKSGPSTSFGFQRKRKFKQAPQSVQGCKRSKKLGSEFNSDANNSDKKWENKSDNGAKSSGSSIKTLRCIFCSGEHIHERCCRYKTAEERRNRLSNRCFLCLRENHCVQDCTTPSISCVHCGKKGHHNRCLCPKRFSRAQQGTTALFSQIEHDTFLQTAVAPVEGKYGNIVSAKLLLDCGSQRSYIHADMAKKLNLTVLEKTCLTVFTFGTINPKIIPANLVNLKIKLRGELIQMVAYIVPSTTGLLPSHENIKRVLRKQHSDLDWADDTTEDRHADIIIGNDYYYKFILHEMREIAENLYLVNTRLGWIPSGRFRTDISSGNYQLSVLTYVERGCVCKNEDFFVRPDPAIRNDDIRLLWELDIIGIKDSPKVIQDEEVIQFFRRTTKFIDNRYYVKWPWVEFPPNLPVNFGLSVGRLLSLFNRLNTDQKRQYNDVLTDQLGKGIIEEVTDTELPKTHPVHYLPHHCVMQEHKSTKLRIVYDASAKVKGHCSLNELLYKGPLMLEDLTTLLLKFRCHSVGIVGDVEKAFLQVGLQHEDRDVTRFLWVRDINKLPKEDNLVHLRFCRVPFGIISSPFLLAATIRHHVLSKTTPLDRKWANSLYVDNLVTGVADRKEGLKLFATAKASLNQLSMNLRGWNSNDKIFLDSIPYEQRDQQQVISVLGIKWDTINDTFQIAFLDSKLKIPAKSKREVLRIIASVFDPCGFVAPLTLPTRMFLQNLWSKGLKWDSPLSPEEVKEWEQCINYLKMVPQFMTQRRYMRSDVGAQPLELHCFADASQDAYVAVVFIRMGSPGCYGVSQVISKSRVTPLQRKNTLTIPKLELLAVVIGTRLLNYVNRALELSVVNNYLWCDNQAVLGWLQSERLLPPWVSRRIGEVQKSKHIRFKYVPSHLNPADVATRPLQTSKLPNSWMSGPEFLHLPPDQWPYQHSQMPEPCGGHPEDVEDTREAQDLLGPHITTQALPTSTVTEQGPHWDLPDQGIILPLRTIKQLQRLHFPHEVSSTKTSLSKSLGIFIDHDGILRCKGRYQNSVLPYNQRYPILMPKESPVTSWIVKKIHNDNYHVGVAHTLSLLREHYWILQGRSAVSKVLKGCPQCVKYGGGPYRLPPMPDLPSQRINYSDPFTYTGLDYLGPLVVTEQGVKHKRWVCLFTCMAIRAIHLEVVENMSTNEFALCLRRFVASRGKPKLILSDNATQFKLLASLLSSSKIKGYGIEWKFITELSPWQGGLYERLVGLVKHCLCRTIDKSMLGNSQLCTVIKEIESVVNTRPLTTVGADQEQVLTPRHFLQTYGPPDLTPPDELSAPYGSEIRQLVVTGWKRTQALLQEFKRMFVSQYLLGLRERHHPTVKQPRVLSPREPQIGDIVQVKGPTPNRGLWQVGKIVGLSHGLDGNIRSAQVVLETGTTIHRSVGHLYPLEMDVGSFTPDTHPQPPSDTRATSPDLPPPTPCHQTLHLADPSPVPSQASLSPPRRPQRGAAIRARQRWRQIASSLFSMAVSAFGTFH